MLFLDKIKLLFRKNRKNSVYCFVTAGGAYSGEGGKGDYLLSSIFSANSTLIRLEKIFLNVVNLLRARIQIQYSLLLSPKNFSGVII